MPTTPTLENTRVRLSPLTLDNYHNLNTIANEKDLIYYSPSNISTPEALKDYVEIAIRGNEERTIIPFLVFDKASQRYAGSTRFGSINWKNKVLHIGWTWIGQEFQGTGLNKNMKLNPMVVIKYTIVFGVFSK